MDRQPRSRETAKAKVRRLREGFFVKYCQGRGLDIGYGGDLLTLNCEGWDLEQGDAQYLKGVEDSTFDFVYSSHTLEHLEDPAEGLRNWYRVINFGGYLILYIPDRNLYEKRVTLPSKWNSEHRHFFLLDKDEPPNTIGILNLIKRSLSNYRLVYGKVCDTGHTKENTNNPDIHPDGEYSIEVVIQKVKT